MFSFIIILLRSIRLVFRIDVLFVFCYQRIRASQAATATYNIQYTSTQQNSNQHNNDGNEDDVLIHTM